MTRKLFWTALSIPLTFKFNLSVAWKITKFSVCDYFLSIFWIKNQNFPTSYTTSYKLIFGPDSKKSFKWMIKKYLFILIHVTKNTKCIFCLCVSLSTKRWIYFNKLVFLSLASSPKVDYFLHYTYFYKKNIRHRKYFEISYLNIKRFSLIQ